MIAQKDFCISPIPCVPICSQYDAALDDLWIATREKRGFCRNKLLEVKNRRDARLPRQAGSAVLLS